VRQSIFRTTWSGHETGHSLGGWLCTLGVAGPGTDPRLRWIAAHCQHVGRAGARPLNYYCVPADAG